MVKKVLLVSDKRRKSADSIPEEIEVQVSGLEKQRDFENIARDTALIIIDLGLCGGLPEKLLAVRSYPPLRSIPVWGLQTEKNIITDNLFLAFGGNRIIPAGEIACELSGFNVERKKPGQEDYKHSAPSMSTDALDYRLTGHMDFMNTQQQLAGMKIRTSDLTETVSLIFDRIFELVRPHIAVILINNNQQATGFIRPSEELFRQDYHDFRNFCLNDFFSYFKGLNLEDIDETFFIDGRDDFDKINMNPQKLSSYISFPVKNRNGDVEATIHLGHLRNNYFSGRVTYLLEGFISAMAGSFYYSLRMHQLRMRKEKLLNIFSRFVPPEIIPDLVKREKDKDSRGADKREIAVLFSDIRSFTTITEQNSAQQVVDFLNRHFNVMVSIIKKHGGTIDKFIGDAIVAIFGAQEGFENRSLNAVRAAMEMIEALPGIDCSSLLLKDDKYGIGIGIHEGPAIVGNIGSEEKADYTAIGDVIGVAEELEALTKKYEGCILVSEHARNQIGGAIEMSLQDRIELGKDGEMEIYAPQTERGASHGG